MKVEHRHSHPSSGKIGKINTVNQRPKPDIISSDKLVKSIALLSKLEYQSAPEKKSYSHKQCKQCKGFFFTIEGKDYSCKGCSEIFCSKHRELSNHNCDKVLPNFEKYLMAKSIFKNKLKEIKSKGH